jgi:hypothetical protein
VSDDIPDVIVVADAAAVGFRETSRYDEVSPIGDFDVDCLNRRLKDGAGSCFSFSRCTMPLQNFAEPEVAVAAVVVGTVASPKLRNIVRRGAVYGIAGALMAYDRTAAVAQGLVKGVRNGVSSIKHEEEQPAAAAPATETPHTADQPA